MNSLRMLGFLQTQVAGGRWRRIGAIIALLAGGGCGGDDGVGPSQSACEADARADVFNLGMEKTAGAGDLAVSLVSATPAPPDKGDNAWVLLVTDAQGSPLEGATVEVTPWMPDHGHGTAITPEVSDDGGGEYAVAPLNLWMPGLWQITLDVTADGMSDSVVFGFCIEG